MVQALKDWAVAIGVAVLVWLAIAQTRTPDLPPQAPDFALARVDGDGQVRLSALRGQTVVLNFWATWCGPCRSEIPEFSRFAEAHPEVAVLGIATDGTHEELLAARAELGITYPVLRTDSQTYKAYDISVIPTTVVVGPDGDVREVHVGAMNQRDLEAAIR